MRLDQVHPGRARLTAFALAGLVSTLGVASTTPASAQSSAPPAAPAGHAAHAAHAGQSNSAAATPTSCRRWTPPTGEPMRVRSSTDLLVGFQLAGIRKGIEVMKARADTDPTSWMYQANMHGTDDQRNLPGWNSCQHESYMFLSWHRMYLYFFERILRKAAGIEVTQPYWNYSDANHLALPQPYYYPANTSNALYVPQRASGINGGCTLLPDDGDYSQAFALTNFSANNPHFQGIGVVNMSFGGNPVTVPTHAGRLPSQFEHQPHDLIHNVVGGPTGYMSHVNTAAQDPIFWAHHANIDRLWSKWLAQGGGRSDPPKSDTVWRNTQFTFFDENGACVLMTGDEVVNTAQQLNYRYDDEPARPSKAGETTSAAPRTKGTPARASTDGVTNGGATNGGATNGAATAAYTQILAESPDGPVQVTGRRRAVPIAIAPERRDAIRALAQTATAAGPTAAAPTAAAPKHVALVLTNFEYSPGAYYKLYLNLPESEQHPTKASPHYIGLIAPFSAHALPGDPNGLTLGFDLTPVIQKLAAAKQWTGEALTVTFVPRERATCPSGQSETDEVLSGNVTVGRLRILTTP